MHTLTDVQLATLQHALMTVADPELDSLRIYCLPALRSHYLWTFGRQHDINFQDPLIF